MKRRCPGSAQVRRWYSAEQPNMAAALRRVWGRGERRQRHGGQGWEGGGTGALRGGRRRGEGSPCSAHPSAYTVQPRRARGVGASSSSMVHIATATKKA